ncbi:glycosyltransferase [Litorihabitans aurantiacus]|uniref:Glycosyl transferase family 1 n=1 Tax=Litorihabitans aurantiacus TaxID=1930061 RepID=A0AA37XE60_9MICO|nr:glycosyltransferase [Litorihabitans aurantiacus]GMA31521.1 glycosyl transferase family 1 [Litorihabitans aurantiacus]
MRGLGDAGRRPGRLRIAVIAPSRHPLRQPHAGGLEAAVWDRVDSLRRRGHRVHLVAAAGSDFMADSPDALHLPAAHWSGAVSSDTDYPEGYVAVAEAALDRALTHLRRHRADFDVVENHSLHALPLVRAPHLGIPMVTTLHTPPLPAMVEAIREAGPDLGPVLAVSTHTARAWHEHGVHARVLPNAVDTARWALGPGGEDLVWFGRLVPEKGAHVAIRAARLLGRRLVLAGRVGDAGYVREEITPHLGDDVVHVGPLRQRDLAMLVGSSACALVTPLWEEPFGLVLAEALCTGTPVAAFDRGGVREVVAGSPGARLVSPGDVEGLAAAVAALADPTRTARARIRAHALQRFSIERQLDEIVDLHRAAAATPVTAQTPAVVPAASAAAPAVVLGDGDRVPA